MVKSFVEGIVDGGWRIDTSSFSFVGQRQVRSIEVLEGKDMTLIGVLLWPPRRTKIGNKMNSQRVTVLALVTIDDDATFQV